MKFYKSYKMGNVVHKVKKKKKKSANLTQSQANYSMTAASLAFGWYQEAQKWSVLFQTLGHGGM